LTERRETVRILIRFLIRYLIKGNALKELPLMECSLQNVFLWNVLNRMFFSGMFFIRVFSFIGRRRIGKCHHMGKR